MAIYSYRSKAFWSETDAAGMVHFSNFFRYCEACEESFWMDTVDGYTEILDKYNVLLPRVYAECSYHRPIYPHDVYRVDIEDIKLGGSSIEFRYTIYNESRGWRSAECRIVVVAVDRERMSSIEIPREVRDRLIAVGAREKSRS